MSRSRGGIQADIVLRNAAVWTVDPDHPYAEALAIRGDEIAAVGQDGDIDPLIGPGTTVYDLSGRLVLPGFNDCHTHILLHAIMASTSVDLHGVQSVAAIQEDFQASALARPDADWLYGFRWSPEFAGRGWPTRMDLDEVEDRRPVAIFDGDWHTAWLNTPALERLGYDADTPDPAGGTILRSLDGFPTGVLFENAFAPVPLPSRPSDEIYAEWILREAGRLNQLGITSVSNMEGRLDNIELTSRLTQNDRLNLRINHWPELPAGLDHAWQAQDVCRGSEKVRVVGLKAFMDGVLSNRTAWLLEPYSDEPGTCGYPISDLDDLTEQALEADRSGFQLVTHAIGDRGVRETLDIYERCARMNGPRDRRHRVEHAELINPVEVGRFASQNTIAAMMPVHCCAPTMEEYGTARIGERRLAQAYVWRALVDSGAHLCFGTDWDAIDLPTPDPLPQIYAATTRIPPQTAGGKPLPHPELCLTIEEAIRCYTLEGAYAEFMEHRKGSITAGKLADLCVLSRNILTGDPRLILETEVVMTVFDGKVVFDRL